MPFPIYRQPDSMDCGPTCLKMIAKYYGKSISLQLLRDRSQVNREGVSLLGISEAAESFGFRTRMVRLNYEALTTNVPLPAILHWDQNHFVVLHKVNRRLRKHFIADPAQGPARVGKEDLLQKWISNKNEYGEGEGIALLLEPTPVFDRYEEESSEEDDPLASSLSFRSMLSYVFPYKKMVFQLLLGVGIASALQLVLPFLTQSVVDVGINTANIHFIYIVLMAQFALFAGRLVIEFIRSWILLHISSRINVSILTDFLIKLMKLPVSFFDTKKVGDIMQRMNDHQRIETFLTGSSINVLFSMVNLAIFSVVLAIFNGTIFTVFASASVLYALWVIVFLKERKALDYKRFDVSAREQSATIQLVQGMQEIKLNGVELHMRWKWERLQAKLFRLNMKSLALSQWQQSGASFVNEGKNILIIFLTAKLVIDGQMTLGTMLAVQYIMGQLNSPIEQMVTFLQSWQNAKLSMNRLNEIHRMEDEEPPNQPLIRELPLFFTRKLSGGRNIAGDLYLNETMDPLTFLEEDLPKASATGSTMPPVREIAITLSRVNFFYPGAGYEPVLKDINLQIPKGKTTAIVGVSGSGKTTLLKLLLKFYEPQAGEIRLNNTPLKNISHSVWRKHCGVVMQESFIFSDTISSNIAVGVEKPDLNRLYHAVRMANIQDFIENLPLGFNTRIGTEGVGISMGQKQRILIARAVYRQPDFIFFDEATNSLDANNETIIIDNLGKFFKDRTVIVVAHRLSTVKNADQIIVLSKGVIVERGTHEELVKNGGEYFTLVKNQLELGG